ncbi:MAG: nucleoside deaminase [Bacilli bacterium]|nr:nucleoside deaminase [Bacilli bacterium]
MNLDEAMKIALDEANLAFQEGEIPVGAVVLKDGELISKAHNNRERESKISGHAEILAIEAAEKKLGRWQLDGCQLVVTLEPCLMCMGAIAQARISTLVYGADDPTYGGISSGLDPFSKRIYPSPLIYRNVMKEESAELINLFFANKRR